jgi:hypothetical protein
MLFITRKINASSRTPEQVIRHHRNAGDAHAAGAERSGAPGSVRLSKRYSEKNFLKNLVLFSQLTGISKAIISAFRYLPLRSATLMKFIIEYPGIPDTADGKGRYQDLLPMISLLLTTFMPGPGGSIVKITIPAVSGNLRCPSAEGSHAAIGLTPVGIIAGTGSGRPHCSRNIAIAAPRRGSCIRSRILLGIFPAPFPYSAPGDSQVPVLLLLIT